MTPASERGRFQLYVAAAGGAIMLIAVLLSMFDGGLPRASMAAGQTGAQTHPETHYVTRLVRARSQPTAQGSSVLATYTRGQALTGTWVMGADRETPWLRVSHNGQTAYVWGKNISFSARPVLAETILQDWTITSAAQIFTEPDSASRQIDVLQPGVVVAVVGRTPGGYLEIAMRQGGVGYIHGDVARPGGSR